jgi:putative heme-binding domain-containing protein
MNVASMKKGPFVAKWLLLPFLAPAAAFSAEASPLSPTLEQLLLKEDAAAVARAARERGDAVRGAIVFYQPYLTCTKCHVSDDPDEQLGPDLAKMGDDVTDAYLIESLLNPSKEIKKGYEPVTILTVDGTMMTGVLVEQRAEKIVLRDPSQDGKLVTIAAEDIDDRNDQGPSIMPAGLVNQLASRQQFLDLVRYLMEIAEKGPARALELRPSPSLYAAAVPDYENDIDHAGMIVSLDEESFERGGAIYNRVCINCHGTKDRLGSLPTSRRFAEEELKNGSDPFSMYQTLTRGFGMMAPQTWMVPKQKYDVIHYIREAYLREFNPTQYVRVDDAYFGRLPPGTSRGPEPSTIEPWVSMDYGPSLMATYEISDDGSNFAYKGVAVRLDPGPGGVSRGRHWMAYDHDTLRVAAAWSGEGFTDWNGINFNGRHEVIPRLVGRVRFANPIGPGWANPDDGGFHDPRLRGRDGRAYGPLPREWAHYKGLYHSGDQVVVSYTVGDTAVLEKPGVELNGAAPVFTRTFNMGARSKNLVLQVARHPNERASLDLLASDGGSPGGIALLGVRQAKQAGAPGERGPLVFDGAAHIEVAGADHFDLTHQDYSIYARIKTRRGGSILCKTAPGGSWVPNGKSLFVRDGRLVFDIGWVGAVESRRSVDDGHWHEVAMTYEHETGAVRLFVDGQLDGQGELKPRGDVDGHVVRLGYTAPDFPEEETFFHGQMSEVRFYQRAFDGGEIAGTGSADPKDERLIGRWVLADVGKDEVRDASGRGRHGKIFRGARRFDEDVFLVAGLRQPPPGAAWLVADDGGLRLEIPAGGEPSKFTLWVGQVAHAADAPLLASSFDQGRPAEDLAPLTRGGPLRWPDILKTAPVRGVDEGPFAVDVLTHPESNPWFCRTRLTGLDFLPDGDRAAVCSWDGSVWLVSGIDNLAGGLTWQRIASGLFQPLGLRVVDGRIHVACRDQIVILHDLNGDGETDFYENFNNDHQVTDHFHEFAMGLQTDAAGNFYYAKAARHAKTAIVPHHGTLLRVSRGGTRTDILAKGFRVPNGVCVNPDGTFFLTDQEGHWIPKNRINWVRGRGGFFGNMWGYHDVADESDEAMEQPLCWITNALDRSPAELVWVDSDAWGPLRGSLLNLSYGYGKVFVALREEVDGQKQGGMCQLPIPRFPTGVMRGRFHPDNGQLYLCGMFAWGGDQQRPGGFYRLRYTGKPVHLPVRLSARRTGMAITFSAPLGRPTASDAGNYAVKTWTLRRTAEYGSDHYGEKPATITAATLSRDGKTVFLQIPEIKPTWCMEIKYSIKGADGEPIVGVIHNTIHRLRE